MLTRWDPFAEIARLTSDLDRAYGPPARRFAPLVDIVEENDAVVLHVEVPGIKADDLDIQVENRVLTLKGERKLERDDQKEGFRRIERAYGSFTRSFQLPETVDGDAIEAHLDAGVLTLRLPKRAVAERRRIQVRTAEAREPAAPAIEAPARDEAPSNGAATHAPEARA